MTDLPAFLDTSRPDVPDLSVPRGVLPFYLPNRPVRGRLVRLGPLAATLLSRHEHAPPVKVLLGQALALAAALATALKFTGSFSVQARGKGLVPMLVTDCTETGALRGYVRVTDDAEIPAAATARDLLGDGYLAFTVDQGLNKEPTQGIVSIEGESLADMAAHYFSTSEQLGAKIFLAAGDTPHGWRASALVLERVAGAGGIDPALSQAEQDDSWATAAMLAATITEAELLDDTLTPEHLLYRLFGAEGVAAAKPRPLSFGCRCSRQRLGGILEGFSTDDLDHMAIEGEIKMTCEFCNFAFCFTRSTITGRPGDQT
ncbi:Hsp33 family molecular chaperone HslO [Acidocella sp.]|uniref:Hsp33 family molecular chaperone HslO n=1 Tax=Acidocella sp. TaxID=50710 RepID=UPI00261A36EC|nr:Hsp33 family molecular chaperone HslO [Acidocella sp.]